MTQMTKRLLMMKMKMVKPRKFWVKRMQVILIWMIVI